MEGGRGTYSAHANSAGDFAAITLSEIRVSFADLTEIRTRISLTRRLIWWSPFLPHSLQIETGLLNDIFFTFFAPPMAGSKNELHTLFLVRCHTVLYKSC